MNRRSLFKRLGAVAMVAVVAPAVSVEAAELHACTGPGCPDANGVPTIWDDSLTAKIELNRLYYSRSVTFDEWRDRVMGDA